MQDRDGAREVVVRAIEKYPALRTLFADRGYVGPALSSLRTELRLVVEVVGQEQAEHLWHHASWSEIQPRARLAVQPKRRVVGRTHAWTGRPRRMAMDFDVRLDVAEAWIWLLHALLLTQGLAAKM